MTDKTFKLGGVTVTPGSKVEPQASTEPTTSHAELLAQATGVLPIGERERLLAQATGQATVRDMAAQMDPARQMRDSIRKSMSTAHDMMLEALTRKAEPVLTMPPLPDFAGMQRAEEQRRIRLAEAEEEARFRRRQELEAAQREQQAKAALVQQPAPARESIEERNDRWLDEERRYKRENKASRMEFCRHIEETEGVKNATVKKALRKAEEKLAEKYREGGATPMKPAKNTLQGCWPAGISKKKKQP